jgi:hypothetical protein
VLFIALAAPSLAIMILACIALVLIGAHSVLSRDDAKSRATGERLWPMVTRALTAVALVFLIAVGVKAVQLGRAETIVHDLVAEFPLRAGPAAIASASADLPNMYLVLLDGYPRADKLESEFRIDVSGFIRGLDDRGFMVASHSRSNHTTTSLTLTQMFDYELGIGSSKTNGAQDDVWRHRINEGRFFADVRGLGYEVVTISPGLEHLALRQADRFIDTGQPNEFEWALFHVTGAGVLVESLLPELAADLARARVLDAFKATEGIALEDSTRPRFIFTHLTVPHSPLIFEPDGAPSHVRGVEMRLADSVLASQLGWTEYARRLEGQIAFINSRNRELSTSPIASSPAIRTP